MDKSVCMEGPLCMRARYIDRCCVCVRVYIYMRSLSCVSLSDGSRSFVADRCRFPTRSGSDEQRGCSLKSHHLPLDSSVDPLCRGSSCTMSRQLTGLMGRDKTEGEQLFSLRQTLQRRLAFTLCETGKSFNKACLHTRHVQVCFRYIFD